MWSSHFERPVARLLVGAVVAGLALSIPEAAHAQSDFLLKRPALTISVFGGWAMPGEDSDLFDFARQELTLDDGDFSSALGMVEAALRVTERLDVALGLEHTSRSVASEMREWVTIDDLPIPRTTKFSRTRFLASGKAYLLPRGRSISQYAWVPYRWSPYIGAGGGISHYEFSQAGDFVVEPDETDESETGDTDESETDDTAEIFEDRLESDGSGLTAHVLVGAQLSLTPRFLLRGEYRYIWGSADVNDSDFLGFNPIDLSGSRVMLGVAVRM